MLNSYTLTYYNKILKGSLSSASVVAPLVLKLMKIESVVDVGCGSGAWLKTFREQGVQKILGLDKNVNEEELLIPKEIFLDCDLTEPLPIQEKFDLAICLEVGEHLPPESAGQLVESLTKLSSVVLFSAAAPFQGGHQHLNEQWPEYWYNFFRKHGYVVVDCLRREVWNNPKVEWWYAQNMLIFVSDRALPLYPEFLLARQITFENQLSIVHPKSLTIRKVIKAFPSLFWQGLKRKLWQKSL